MIVTINTGEAEMRYAEHARSDGWGSDRNARRITGLTAAEREFVRGGGTLMYAGAPLHQGTTERRIVEIGGRFYARLPWSAA